MKITEPGLRSRPVNAPQPELLATSVIGAALSQPPGTPAVALGHGGEVLAIGFRVSAAGLQNPVQWRKEVTRYTTILSSHAGSEAGVSDVLALTANAMGHSHPAIVEGLGFVGDVGGVVFHGLETRNAILEGDRLGAAIASVQVGGKAVELIGSLTHIHGLSGLAVFLDIANVAASAWKKYQLENPKP